MNKIMLIDDDPTMLKLLKTLLEIEGYMPATWSGSGDIIQETKQNHPGIILLDVNLRGINGIDIMRLIRSDPELANTPVIMTSGIDYREQCLAVGANDFLVKPYMPNDLIESIRNYLPEEANHGS